MARGFIVDDIINEVRSLVDEYNNAQLDDVGDILPSLNRGQELGIKILSRIYPDPIMSFVDIAYPTTRELTIPEEVWEDGIDCDSDNFCAATDWMDDRTNQREE